MGFKFILQNDRGQFITNFSDPVEIEIAYFEAARKRTTGPGAIKIFSSIPEIVPSAYFRLDRKWTENREQDAPRLFIWVNNAEQFQEPTGFQKKALGKIIGNAQKICGLLGISPRTWQYVVADERKIGFARWRIILEFAGLVNTLPSQKREN